jgi:hypothetical protein
LTPDDADRYTVGVLLINPLNAEIIPVCHLLALLRARYIFHVSGLRVNITEYAGTPRMSL